MFRKSVMLFGLMLALVLSSVLPVSAHGHEEGSAMVYVVHGIPGADLGLDPALPVDISVNGACALTAFPFGEIAGPVELAEGSYDIAIRLANAEMPCGNDPVIQGNFAFEGGETAAVVAYLDGTGAPTAAKFDYDFSGLYRSRAMIFAHHLTAAPTVDLSFVRQELVDGRVSSRSLHEISNGMYGGVMVRPGTWDLFLRPVADRHTKLGPITIPGVQANTVYLAYAVGSLESGTFTLLTKEIPLP